MERQRERESAFCVGHLAGCLIYIYIYIYIYIHIHTTICMCVVCINQYIYIYIYIYTYIHTYTGSQKSSGCTAVQCFGHVAACCRKLSSSVVGQATGIRTHESPHQVAHSA